MEWERVGLTGENIRSLEPGKLIGYKQGDTTGVLAVYEANANRLELIAEREPGHMPGHPYPYFDRVILDLNDDRIEGLIDRGRLLVNEFFQVLHDDAKYQEYFDFYESRRLTIPYEDEPPEWEDSGF